MSTLLSGVSPKRRVGAALVLLFALLACFVPAGAREQINGRVVAVADGDTIIVLDAAQVEHRVRFAFIDAPEKAQAFGQRAKAALAARVYGREVRVEVVDRDHYGRNVGRVWQGDSDVNLVQLTDGYAWHYRQYAQNNQPPGDFARYAGAEAEARQAQRGLWQEPEPTAPWAYRRASRQ
ncbi:thermonuclease family protein [Neisseriaceae bacterium JH1-16]|nr:thermonuclease family protein [Neisseriaceae bacterium JH1-16]